MFNRVYLLKCRITRHATTDTDRSPKCHLGGIITRRYIQYSVCLWHHVIHMQPFLYPQWPPLICIILPYPDPCLPLSYRVIQWKCVKEILVQGPYEWDHFLPIVHTSISSCKGDYLFKDSLHRFANFTMVGGCAVVFWWITPLIDLQCMRVWY